MDPRPTKPDARPANGPDVTRPARASALDPTVARPNAPDEPLTDADKFLSPPQTAGEVGRLGPYRVLGVLGRGGMGAVYRAHDPRLNRDVAVKVLLPDLAADARAKARFRREAQAQARVEHDHIIPIHEVEEANGVAYLVMPLLKGQTLAAALKSNRRPPVAELVRIGREIAEGLAAAHEVGLIHRDIKPANVWLEGNRRRVKILDFGLARTATEGDDPRPAARAARDSAALTHAGAVLGTPAYMSPEQARGLPVDARSDVFSLGVVLYEMATGRKPFNGANPFELLAAVATQEPYRAGRTVPDLPAALDDLIHRMLAKDPAARPQTCDAVAAELEAIARALVVPPVVVMPLASTADLPNVWEDLDTTHATGAQPEPDATRADGSSEEEPEGAGRRVPRWALPAGGALLAVVLIALALPKPKPAQVPADPNPGVPQPNVLRDVALVGAGALYGVPREAPPAPAPDHRAAAEWVLRAKKNTRVGIAGPDGSVVPITKVEELPPGPVTVVQVVLYNLYDADEPQMAEALGALGELKLLAFNGPAWTDARLAAALTALKVKKVADLRIQSVPERLVRAGKALDGWSVGELQLYNTAPDLIRLADIKGVALLDRLRIEGALTDDGLDGVSARSTWPKVFDLSGNPNLTDAGLGHFVNTGRADRAASKITFDLRKTGVTADGVAALARRFPEATITWDAGTTSPLIRRRAAAKVALDRGAQLTLFGGTPLKSPAELTDKLGFRQLDFGSGPLAIPTDARPPQSHWYQGGKGTIADPFTAEELERLLPDLPCQSVNLYGQNLTDPGAARMLRAIDGDGIVTLHVTSCGAGDATARAIAERPSVAALSLTDTQLTDAGLAHLVGRMPRLYDLRLMNTPLTDAAVPHLAAFPLLSALDLKGTKITAKGMETLTAALPYTLIRDPNGNRIEPARQRPASRDAAAQELFARGVIAWNAGSPVLDPKPKNLGTGPVQLALRSGSVPTPATPANGWDGKEAKHDVAKPFDAPELVVLLDALKLTRVSYLELHGQHLTNAGVAALCALPAVREVEELWLTECDAIGDPIVEHLARLPKLRSLYLNGTKVTAAGVARLADAHPMLDKLRLRDCELVTEDVLPHLAKLKRLYELDLKGVKIKVPVARDLLAELPYTSVRLPHGMTAREPRARGFYDHKLAAQLVIARGPTLGLGGNPALTDPALFPPAASQVVLRLRNGDRFDPHLPNNGWEERKDEKDKKTSVAPAFDDAELMALIGDLRVASFQFVAINKQKVTDVGVSALVRLPAVREAFGVEVVECDVGDATALHLAALPKLTYLALNRTKVTNAGVKALLPRAETLESLRLAFTAVDDAAIDDLIQFKRLEALDLGGTKVTEGGAKRLAAALPRCHIRYGDNQKLGPKARLGRAEAFDALIARKARFHVAGGPLVTSVKGLPATGRGVGFTAESGTFRGNANRDWDSNVERTGTVTDPLTDDDLERLAAVELPHMPYLTLRAQKVTDAGLVALLRTPGARRLASAYLADCAVGDDTARALAELPDLRTVYLQNAPRLTDAGAIVLLQTRRGLQAARFTGCEALTDDIEPHLARLFALSELDLRGTKVSDAACERLSRVLQHTHIRGNGRLIEPKLPRGQRDAAQQAVAHLIARGTTKALGGPLDADKVLTDPSVLLRVASGRYFEPSGPGGWEKPADGPVKEPFGDAELVRYLSELNRPPTTPGPVAITSLALHRQNLTDAGVAALVALPQLRDATGLHVTECDVGDEAARHIAALPKLRSLFLNRTKVGNAGVKHLVPRAETLDNLRLAHTLVTDDAIDDLLKLTNLTNLDLGGTKVTKEGAEKLAAGLPKCLIRWGDNKDIPPAKK